MTHSKLTAGVVFRRWIALLSGLLAVSILHYTTNPAEAWLHNIYQRLYYAPIVLGAYWFGVRGGLLTALAAALAYWPHIHYTWGANAPYAASQYAELVIFQAAGLLVGFLADAQRRLTWQYQAAAASLEVANRDLRESQAHLMRADRLSALGEVAAGLAHEVRNPLASVEGALEIVASRVAADTPEAEFTSIARRELRRLETLLSEFLSYARPRGPELRRASLHDVIEHVVLLIKPEAERASVAVVREEAVRLPDVHMDPEQIRQVLFNIVLNGIQASPERTTLTIRTGLAAQWAVVEVQDSGPGIPAGQRERLFDPFFTTKSHGTGLGLAVSQRIVTAHGGRIDIDDGQPPGAVVRLVLPLPTRTGAATGQS
ncbi:MAG: ATP-binding protein [Acidobacteriota bacterium]